MHPAAVNADAAAREATNANGRDREASWVLVWLAIGPSGQPNPPRGGGQLASRPWGGGSPPQGPIRVQMATTPQLRSFFWNSIGALKGSS